APTTTSFVGGGPLSNVNDAYDGLALTFTSGLNQGQTRTVLSYAAATQTFTFSNPWVATPAAGDSFILSEFAITLINNRIKPDGTTQPPAPAPPFGIAGTKLGFENGVDLGTIFDQ